MIHEDPLKDKMSVIHLMYTPCKDATRYHDPNRNILQVATTLESILEQSGTTLVKIYNQQHKFRWVINHINLTLVQGQVYTEWEILESCEKRIFIKSSYYEILEEFGLPKFTLWRTLNLIFLSLKCSSLNHLWDIIGVGNIIKKIFIEVIAKKVVKKKSEKKLTFSTARKHKLCQHEKKMVHMNFQ